MGDGRRGSSLRLSFIFTLLDFLPKNLTYLSHWLTELLTYSFIGYAWHFSVTGLNSGIARLTVIFIGQIKHGIM